MLEFLEFKVIVVNKLYIILNKFYHINNFQFKIQKLQFKVNSYIKSQKISHFTDFLNYTNIIIFFEPTYSYAKFECTMRGMRCVQSLQVPGHVLIFHSTGQNLNKICHKFRVCVCVSVLCVCKLVVYLSNCIAKDAIIAQGRI